MQVTFLKIHKALITSSNDRIKIINRNISKQM